MQNLNYSRQLAKECQRMLKEPGLNEQSMAIWNGILDLHGASTKFLLPDNGIFLEDFQFKALDIDEVIRLPYPYISIEFKKTNDEAGSPPLGSVIPSKTVIFARERDDWIAVTAAFFAESTGQWFIKPTVLLPKVNFLNRENISDEGHVAIRFAMPDAKSSFDDHGHDVSIVLGFLNVLQCSNVGVQRIEPQQKLKRKSKAALPFDAYHVLTVSAGKYTEAGGVSRETHRSPREHLRRGHIRRLQDGRRIWVNAAVVGAGHGAGVITKDYAFRPNVAHP